MEIANEYKQRANFLQLFLKFNIFGNPLYLCFVSPCCV